MSRFAIATYCDDIRYEMNGKVSLIGTFAGNLHIGGFPSTIPKLCVLVTVNCLRSNLIKDLLIKGSYGESTAFEVRFDEQQIISLKESAMKVEGNLHFTIQAMMEISPFHVEKPDTFKIEVLADGEILFCPGFQIFPADPATNPFM